MKEFTAGTVNLVRRLVARKVIGASGETTAVVLLKMDMCSSNCRHLNNYTYLIG